MFSQLPKINLNFSITFVICTRINDLSLDQSQILSFGRESKVLCHKMHKDAYIRFNPFPNKPWFLHVCSTSLLKTLWEKDKLLLRSNFSFSHNVFYPFGELSSIFVKFEIVVCKLFQFGRV